MSESNDQTKNGGQTPPPIAPSAIVLPDSVTVDSLKEKYGAAGEKIYHEISRIGGFGDYSANDYIGGCPELDVKNLSDDAKLKITELLKSVKTSEVK